MRAPRIHHALGADSNIQFRGNFAGDKGLVSYHVLVKEIEYREAEIDFTADLLVEFNGIEGGIIEGLKFTSVLA